MKYEIAQMGNRVTVRSATLPPLPDLTGLLDQYICRVKTSCRGLTKSVGAGYAAKGNRINAVAPGTIRTEIISGQVAADGEYRKAMHPIVRLGRFEEIANGMAWLLSDEAISVVWHVLNIDEGFQA